MTRLSKTFNFKFFFGNSVLQIEKKNSTWEMWKNLTEFTRSRLRCLDLTRRLTPESQQKTRSGQWRSAKASVIARWRGIERFQWSIEMHFFFTHSSRNFQKKLENEGFRRPCQSMIRRGLKRGSPRPAAPRNYPTAPTATEISPTSRF